MRRLRDARTTALLAVVMVLFVWAAPRGAGAEESDDLTELLQDVGQAYAEGYLAPVISGFGINQNSGLYHTAAIPNTGLKISIGFKAMMSNLDDEDKTFRVVKNVDLSNYVAEGDPGYGEDGVIVMEGPTVMGEEDVAGSVTGYWNGIPVYHADGVESLIDLDFVPLITPEFGVGGMGGFKATVRWLPETTVEKFKIKYMGYGLAYNVNALVPTLPIDVTAGFFLQELNLGESVKTKASSYYVAASKGFGLLTAYGGFSVEDSSMDVEYYFPEDDIDVDFSVDGVQSGRTTLGATLNLGLLLNAEIGIGNMTTFTGGLIFGF